MVCSSCYAHIVKLSASLHCLEHIRHSIYLEVLSDVVRSCYEETDKEPNCTTTGAVETCYCNGRNLCTDSSSSNSAHVIKGTISVTIVTAIVTGLISLCV